MVAFYVIEGNMMIEKWGKEIYSHIALGKGKDKIHLKNLFSIKYDLDA